MLRIQAPTAYKDVTFNNIKASKSSVNDMYAQTITRIEGGEAMEVFSTVDDLVTQLRTMRDQNTALLQRITTLETRLTELSNRVNELTVE